MRQAALVVHGHFYQPPRENPWTEEVAREPSAAPFHDWNERITFECYRPNAFARVLDVNGHTVSVVNTYEHISYDFGPTLLSWMEVHAPEVYRRVIEADQVGQGAMAQAFFHVILPLATERDARTLVRWGIADFRYRFGRDPEGLWLPETAVNETVMAILVEEGIRFTILAPDQAAGPVDTRRPYQWAHPDGLGTLDVVFFDASLSHAVAFEGLTSQALVDRVSAAAPHGGLVCVATDGETFGHHHKYADRALAYALNVEGPRRGLTVTNPVRLLRSQRPVDTVAVRESAWSCAHGVGRWKENCGCSTGGQPGWTQDWRAPLRAALDVLRDAAAEVFSRRGEKVLHDPWAARDAYIDVLVSPSARVEFTGTHIKGDRVEAFTLLEIQRHVLAMYTSCAWFFNDLAGIETVYVLRIAHRVIDLLRELGEEPPEDEFLAVLATARSNEPEEADGRSVWQRHVLPARVDAERVAAHLALIEVLDRPLPEGRLAGYAVDLVEHTRLERGNVAFSCGRVGLIHHRTGRRTDHLYAALHLGGLELFGSTRLVVDPAADSALLADLRDSFDEGLPVAKLFRKIGDVFGNTATEFDLSSAVPGAADQILERTASELADRFAAAYERLFNDHRGTLDALTRAGYKLPPELRAPAELSLSRMFEAEVAAQAGSSDPEAYRDAVGIARDARRRGVRLDTPAALAVMERSIKRAVTHAVDHPEDPAAIENALQLMRLARDLDLYPNIDAAQETLYNALVGGGGTPALRLLGTALGLAVEVLGQPS